MKSEKRGHQANRGTHVKSAASAGKVAFATGEAVVGPIAKLFPSFPPIPGDSGEPWLYFSVPNTSFEALKGSSGKGLIEVRAELGTDEFADMVWVRVRVFAHCALILIPAQEEPFATALRTFTEAARIRILVASQSVCVSPVVFETTWTPPTRTRDARGTRRDYEFLRIESGFAGAVSQLTTCEAETPEDWKERLQKEAVA